MTLHDLKLRVQGLISRRRVEREVEEELAFHIERDTQRHIASGLSAAEARNRARARFGPVALAADQCRDARGTALIDDLARDFRYAIRGFCRQPGFMAIATLTLALGIGANAAVFSVVHGVLMQPLGYEDPDALLSVTRTMPGPVVRRWISLLRWETVRDARSFELAMYRPVAEDVILGGREPEALRSARISANLLGVLGVEPILGRGFLPDEDGVGSAPVALIGERLWAERFERDPSIVGVTLRLSALPYTVIGVLPAGFQFPVRGVDIWLPRPAEVAVVAPQFQSCCVPLAGVARLRKGATRQQAKAELEVLNARYEPQDGPARVDAGPAMLTPLKEDVIGSVDTMLWMLLAAVTFVLLIACANVATLLMARATARAREFAVRTALGAGRARVIRQLVVESLVLSMIGGGLGLLFARAGVDAIATMTLFDLPRAHEISVSGTVLLWTLIVAVATGVLFGTVPSLRLVNPALIERLRQSGGTESGSRWERRLVAGGSRGALVVAQIALSMVLLIGAALMAQTVARLSRVDLGFRSTGLLTMRVPLPVAVYDTPEKRATFFDELVRRVEAVPGIRGATVAEALPTTGGLFTNLQIASQRIPDPGHTAMTLHTVGSGYFDVMGLPLKQGRAFELRDNVADAPPVAIVNESFARRFWPSYPGQATPLGDHLEVPLVTLAPIEIVGVVADVRHAGVTRKADPQVYLPDRLFPPQVASLAVLAGGDPLSVVKAIRTEVRAIDGNQSVADIRTMDEILVRSVGRQHLAARVLGLFAVTALLLAVIGLYGVTAYSVTERTREIGIRRALGAGHRGVLWMVLAQGLRVTFIGIACGVAGAYASTRLLESLLFEVATTDVVTFLAVSVVFVLVALFASLVPALRATRIDPAVALRA